MRDRDSVEQDLLRRFESVVMTLLPAHVVQCNFSQGKLCAFFSLFGGCFERVRQGSHSRSELGDRGAHPISRKGKLLQLVACCRRWHFGERRQSFRIHLDSVFGDDPTTPIHFSEKKLALHGV